MPIYEYKCLKCGAVVEHMRRASEYNKPQSCECGAEMERIITSPPLILGGRVHEKRKMRTRFKKRNAKLEAMPPAQRKRMSAFMKKYNVKRYM